MLIQSDSNKYNTHIAVKKYLELINQGISRNRILFIVLNSYKKEQIIGEIKKSAPELNFENSLGIHTFGGLCYNAFKDNKEYIMNLLEIEGNDVEPNLCGLDVSQYIFKQSIKTADFSDYLSKINLLHQLFRRYSLIVQNNLNKEEIKVRSQILGESFYLDAQKAIEDYKKRTVRYKSFDYLRQLAVLPLIYKNTDYFKKINYLIVLDADEFSYAFWLFVDSIMPDIKDYMITYSKNGSSRCGYLCAYKKGVLDFKKKYSPVEMQVENKSVFKKTAGLFFKNLCAGEKTKFENIIYKKSIKRLDMFDSVIKEAEELIKNGIKPSDIAIISPLIDEVLINTFKFTNSFVDFQIYSGSEKLISSKTVKFIVYILKLICKIKLQDYELKSLLIKLINIPYKKCLNIVGEYNKTGILPEYNFEKEDYNYAYTKLVSVINSFDKTDLELSECIKIIFTNIIKEFSKDYDIEKYDFFVKEAISFEKAFKNEIKNIAAEFINQAQNSVISENPIESFNRIKNSIIIATPQKITDCNLETKYQFWLDISSGEWLKQDTGTLYNAWVFNREWNKKEYTLEDNINLTREKTARCVRKLILCAGEEIRFYSSIYDNNGNENFGGLEDYVEFQNNKSKPAAKIIPRKDQRPVLEYKSGKTGIMAVPGAGKTTILLALVVKLLESGIKAENIFVLTYMESAAKNFKERLQTMLPDYPYLPNISTIHGLALRIIKENGNYIKIGLDENFEICDDNMKERIIKELFFNLKIDEEKYDNYIKAVSTVKLSGNSDNLHSVHKEINEFFNFFNQYNCILKQNNLIDYDDMLSLSVKILDNYPEILQYYQEICKYIIEDEAQDSSLIQQKLISFLTGKYKNLIRCGDVNQSITSTFTNSDSENFLKFIQNNKKIEMVSSQRCAKSIYTLANNLIKTAVNTNVTQGAFYPIEIQGTNNNPADENKPEYIIFESEEEEKSFILSKVKQIITSNPDKSIAILLRLNSQVNIYNELFLSNGIETMVKTDCLIQKKIYKIIYSALKIAQNPLNNTYIYDFALSLKDSNIYNFTKTDMEFIKNSSGAFININPDLLEAESLLQLYWDIDYILNNSYKEIENIALDTGLYYSKNNTDKSNTYLIFSLLKRIKTDKITNDEVIKHLEYAALKPQSANKFFEDESKSENETLKVNIMTVHKSKGDEFDYVFLPEMNENNYAIEIENIKLKSGSHFIQAVKNAVVSGGMKTPEQLKIEQINETLRLLYVAVTRAKSALYITSAKNYKRHKNSKCTKFFLENCLK
ncbi:MAG: ATP-dependent helicase [Candidatus Gastranaerophilales bacterium]|nr:ATP-dependent helicase [Candidatus Gastranaerophilales bacterium]